MLLLIIVLSGTLGIIVAEMFFQLILFAVWKLYGEKKQKEIDDNPKYRIKHITI